MRTPHDQREDALTIEAGLRPLEQVCGEEAAIHWLDEAAIVNTDVRGRSYAKRGKTPVVYAPGSRTKLSMISTVTNKGKATWEIIDRNFNVDRSLCFLHTPIKGKRKKLYVIMDDLRAHHSKRIKQWVVDHAHRIAVFRLPSYAQELIPSTHSISADLLALFPEVFSADQVPKDQLRSLIRVSSSR